MKTTIESIIKAFEENHFKATTITCPDGVEVVVTPCSYAEEITSVDQCDYFLVHGDMPWMGGSKLEDVVKEINDHARLAEELDNERKELRVFFDKHQTEGWNDDAWSWYSDWHKDLYGYRPHGRVCGEYIEPYKGACLRW